MQLALSAFSKSYFTDNYPGHGQGKPTCNITLLSEGISISRTITRTVNNGFSRFQLQFHFVFK